MARREIPTPTTAAEPANAGTIEIVATTHGTFPLYPSGSECQNYLFVAKPNLGWTFVSFRVEFVRHTVLPEERTEPESYDCFGTYDDDRQGYVYETTTDNGPTPPGYIDYPPQNFAWYQTDYVVTAVFRRTGHTDLLVNSSARESLVRLVHDPATNRLVADY